LTTVAVEDLLLRPAKKIDYARLEALVKARRSLSPAVGGSIGSEICDRIVTFGAGRLLVIENFRTGALCRHRSARGGTTPAPWSRGAWRTSRSPSVFGG